MSARTTGATESQIEAAAKRMHDIRSERNKLPHPQVWPCAGCMGSADAWADCLVRPDQRIVEAADLAELVKLIDYYAGHRLVKDDRDLVDRIRALR